ncbi:MAG: M42 family peptidase [Oscillospiraceae bacterium]|nr:M42 family peptidase [Oscillospiraceae bacterium]
MTLLDTMETLCCLDGVSGREDEVRDYILERAMPFADEIRTDPMGNLMIFKKGDRPRTAPVMLCAHMDEVGLMVTGVTAEGYLRFDTIGGIDRRVLIGKRVYVGPMRVKGVVGSKAFHLTTAEQRRTLPEIESMYIDIGAPDKAAAEAQVSLGDTVAFEDGATRFGDGYIRAKAIDDRAGCAVMLELIESRLSCDCWFAFTVQEEVGCRGAAVAARSIQPQTALILEGTTAADIPGVEGVARTCALGQGVVIPFMDKGTIYHKGLYQDLTRLAEENGIPWQTKTRIAGGTDASAIQRADTGVQVAALSVPVRNIHSPACVAKESECQDQYKLARLFLQYLAE